MTFGSSFWKKGHSIHKLWCIFIGLRHNDLWVESHMWPQQTWGQRSSRVNDLWFSFFEKKGHYIYILWCIFMRLSHNDPWVESYMWPQQTWGQSLSTSQWPLVQVFEKNKGSLYPDTLTYSHGTLIQWSLGRVIRVTSTEVGSRVILGSVTFG